MKLVALTGACELTRQKTVDILLNHFFFGLYAMVDDHVRGIPAGRLANFAHYTVGIAIQIDNEDQARDVRALGGTVVHVFGQGVPGVLTDLDVGEHLIHFKVEDGILHDTGDDYFGAIRQMVDFLQPTLDEPMPGSPIIPYVPKESAKSR